MRRPVYPSLSPNLETSDFFQALKALFMPFRYLSGPHTVSLEQWFRQFFNVSYAVSFNSGRACLFAILKTLGIGKGDEVIIQAFTCVAVPNAIIWLGAKPVYADIDETLTMDVNSLEERITRKTKAIIVQHTFGVPAYMEKITQIAKKRGIIVIEDCAHGIGYTYKGKKLGVWGDAAFFSFGRDKAFSSVFGGIAITDDEKLGKKLRQFQKKQSYPGLLWTIQQVLHPISFFFILPLYDFFSLGKAILVVLQKIGLLSFPVSNAEKKSDKKSLSIKKMPNALSYLALFQLKRLSKFNNHRREISRIYLQELNPSALPYPNLVPFLRFPIKIESKEYVRAYFRKRKIYLSSWCSNIIDPKGVDLQAVFYKKGSCPLAEQAAKTTIELPTYPTISVSEVRKVIAILKECAW